MFVILAGFAEAAPDIQAGWLFYSSWQQPNVGYRVALLPPDFVGTQEEERRLQDARGAFLKLRSRRGRPQGSGRFETTEDFEQAVFAAVAALYKQKRAITQKTVGNYIIAKSGRNATLGWHAGDSPADPDRQLREWCTQFERNPGELIQLAIAACASKE